MTKHILCAVDLSHLETEVSLIKKAAELAKFYGASLSVVTVVPDYGMTIVGSFFKEGTMKEAVNVANQRLHEFVEANVNGLGKVQHIVKVGTPYEQILEAIKIAAADLVVLGAHKPELMDRLQGPNSARVARYAPCSVLVVRN